MRYPIHMSALPLIPSSPAEPPANRKRFTRAEVRSMDEAGLFAGQRLELIEGDLIDKMGQRPPHASTIRLLLAWLISVFGVDHVSVQLPIEAAPADRERSLPEPDLAVLRESIAEYHHRHPEAAEVVLLIEVADATLAFDLTAKAALYARAGVADYWVIDLNRRAIIVHRNPEGSVFRDIRRISESDAIAPLAAPQAAVVVRMLLPGPA